MNDDARRVSETLGTGQEVFAHWGGRVKDVHANCRDKIEHLRKERDHYWATTNDAISERNHWVRLFKLAFDSHFDKTWDGETADLLGQAFDEAECICGDDEL
jgi:hypothetical protein